jgi:hypothetical protein
VMTYGGGGEGIFAEVHRICQIQPVGVFSEGSYATSCGGEVLTYNPFN